MKKLIAVLVALILTAAQVVADSTMTVSTVQNVKIVVAPNGPLDTGPTWSSTGSGVLQVDAAGYSAVLITATAGTNVVTINGTSGGTLLTTKVTIVVSAPVVPPATSLGVNAVPVLK